MSMGDGQIRDAVPIEIRDDHGHRIRCGRIRGCGLETAVVPSYGDADTVELAVCHDDVLKIVSIQIPHDHGDGLRADRVKHRLAE